MVGDLFNILIITIAFESLFSISFWIFKQYRNHLLLENVKENICTSILKA